MLSATQIESYQTNGYLVVDNVLSEAQVAELNALIDHAVERSIHVESNDDMYDLEPGHSKARPRVRGIRDPLALAPPFEEVSRSEAVLDIVESVVGPNIRHELSFINIKPAGGGSPVQWHQDFGILPYTNDDLVVCGLALTDSSIRNGCLQVIPGSHRGPILDHHQDGVMIGAVQEHTPGFDLDHAVPVEVPAGGMSLHHFRILHGSAPNHSDSDRRVYFLDYAAADSFPIAKKIAPAEFDQRIVRGTSTRQARMIPLNFPIPNRERRANVLFHLQAGLREPVYS
ncbi:phytanoyl-CoA dioxygenase family protein [Nocardia asiatica]|uniref:phytanoyl-CoA dioxygenase family protein n=1 Tax=Nocardia asiatica TaxID=209252 RepID=UPI0002FBA950|nr:phytanoyl-CoA dioxygenase family protein [Nocardia asiatica]